MKRDWKIIEQILEAIELNKVRIHWESQESDEQRKLVQIHYDLLQESDLIANYELKSDMDDDMNTTVHPPFTQEDPSLPYMHLTMKGYDLLEVLRDKRLWNRIVTKAKDTGVKLTFEFIKQAIPIIYKQLL